MKKQMFDVRKGFALGVSILAIAISGNAQAQDAGDDADTDVIVVTAQFREQNLQETPLAITAYDASGGAGFASLQPGHPREWALSVKKHF